MFFFPLLGRRACLQAWRAEVSVLRQDLALPQALAE